MRQTKYKHYQWPTGIKRLLKGIPDPWKAKPGDITTWLERITGNPRHECRRYLHNQGIIQPQKKQYWPEERRQQLLGLLERYPVKQVARIMQCPPASIYRIVSRCGTGVRAKRDWLSIGFLSRALHVSCSRIQQWIDSGKLKATRQRKYASGGWWVIGVQDFQEFCLAHKEEVVGQSRLNPDRLNFLFDLVWTGKPLKKVREKLKKQRKR